MLKFSLHTIVWICYTKLFQLIKKELIMLMLSYTIPVISYFISSSLLSFITCIVLMYIIKNVALGYSSTVFSGVFLLIITSSITYESFTYFFHTPTEFWEFILLSYATLFVFNFIYPIFLILKMQFLSFFIKDQK